MGSPLVPADQDPIKSTIPVLTEDECRKVTEALFAGVLADPTILTTIPALTQQTDTRRTSDTSKIWEATRKKMLGELFDEISEQAEEGLKASSAKLGIDHNREFSKVDKELIKGILEVASAEHFTQNEMTSFLVGRSIWLADLIPAHAALIWKQRAERDEQGDEEDQDPFYYPMTKFLIESIEAQDARKQSVMNRAMVIVIPTGQPDFADFIIDNVVEKMSEEAQLEIDSADITQIARLVLSNKLIPAMARSDQQRLEMQIALFVQIVNDLHAQNLEIDEDTD